MSKKHYEQAAAVIRSVRNDKDGRRDLAEKFADMYAEENPRFDRDKFYEACGVKAFAVNPFQVGDRVVDIRDGRTATVTTVTNEWGEDGFALVVQYHDDPSARHRRGSHHFGKEG